jgi:hypothetical protein
MHNAYFTESVQIYIVAVALKVKTPCNLQMDINFSEQHAASICRTFLLKQIVAKYDNDCEIF